MIEPLKLHRVRVWDLPTRIFHWSLPICFTGLIVTGSIGGGALNWHFRFGYAMASLLLFRVFWGLVGGRWSRFAAFIYSPSVVLDYLKGARRPEDSIGHSPLGAASVFAMLSFLIAQVVSGMMSDDEISAAGPLTRFVSNNTVSLASNYHADIGKWILLALVVLHLAAIGFYHLRRHRLIVAMVSGDKALEVSLPGSRDDKATRLIALAIFAVCAAGVYWISTLDAPAF